MGKNGETFLPKKNTSKVAFSPAIFCKIAKEKKNEIKNVVIKKHIVPSFCELLCCATTNGGSRESSLRHPPRELISCIPSLKIHGEKQITAVFGSSWCFLFGVEKNWGSTASNLVVMKLMNMNDLFAGSQFGSSDVFC